MAQFINALEIAQSAFRGLPKIYQFTNWDGELVPYNCGQAAACTYLTFHGLFPMIEEQAAEIMQQIECDHPPDNLGGWFGTSRRRVERICRSHGIVLKPIHGEQKLRERLQTGQPVVVMLGVPGPKLLKRWVLPTGHWMVAYGFDEAHIHLTNWGKMPWELFRRRWASFVPRVIGMLNTGLSAAEPLAASRKRDAASGG